METKRYGLRHPYFSIKIQNDRSYGGSQTWSANRMMRKYGCGVVGMADVLLYLGLHQTSYETDLLYGILQEDGYLSYPRYYGREDYEAARSAMDTTGSRQHENTNITQLSGGQRQGVYLAMALAQDTRTIFMDEPTTYLDISHQFRLMETARSLAREGKAVVLVLHDISLALREADVIAVFQDGRLLCCDTPDIVYQKGVMEEVFGVGIHRMETPHGIQYYCTPKEV